MILSYFAGLAVVTTKTTIDPQLTRLGEVSVFVDPLPKGNGESPNSRFYHITDDGRRIFQGRPGTNQYLHTWKLGEKEVLTLLYGVDYGLDRHRPSANWQWFRNGGLHSATASGDQSHRTEERWARVSRFVQIVGPLDNNRIAFWFSGQGDHGVVASCLFWIDVTKRGPGAAGISFFQRTRSTFQDLDLKRRLLIVRSLDKYGSEGEVVNPGVSRAYTLPSDYRRSRKVPFNDRYRDRYQGRHSVNNRWDVSRGKDHQRENDRRTGKATTIPVAPKMDMWFQYVQNDLFLSLSNPDDRTDQSLSLWNRSLAQLELIGPWVIAGHSPNGQFMIVRKIEQSKETAPQYFISRREVRSSKTQE